MSNFQILFQAVSSSMVKIPFPLFLRRVFKQPSSLSMYFLVAILSLYGMNAHADYASRIQIPIQVIQFGSIVIVLLNPLHELVLMAKLLSCRKPYCY